MTTITLRRRLAELDAEIVAQKASLDALEHDRTAVQRQLHETSTFSVLTLPVEITAEIFSLCLPSIEELREDERSIAERLECQAPTLFLGVCRAWKEIALGTPELWTTLSLCLDIVDEDVASNLGEIEEWIDRWLARAAPHTLSIAFRMQDEHPAEGPFTPSRMRSIIHRHAPRVQHLELILSQHYLRQLDLDSAVFPLLQRAVLGESTYGPDPDPSDPVELFNNAPQLRELYLTPGTLFIYYNPPSLQLTKFDGEIFSLELFKLAPNLTEVRCCMGDLYSPLASPTSHASLRSLTLLKSHPNANPLNLLFYLTLPALQSLNITDVKDSAVSTHSLRAFLTRSSPPLQTLSAWVQDKTFDDWNSCFSCVSDTLENLEVHSPDSEFQSEVFTLGTPNSRYDPLPRLRTLHLVDAPHTDYNVLVNFLHIRASTPALANIRSLRLIWLPGVLLQERFSAEINNGTRHGDMAHFATSASKGINIHIATTQKTYIEHIQYLEAYNLT
ncbi:hypothetical protein DFH09DRAFT_494215 [Mycena vulgaris]|nr:hypothetical protein DFH09DRAFT_494215 [Mycena vulgaris]